MRKSNLYASTSISSQGTPDAAAEPAAQRNPIGAEMISSGRGALGESNDKARMQGTELNESASMFLQNFVHEWLDFVGKRTRQHMHLIKRIQGCRSLPDLQQAYSEFWQNAFTQYVEEPRRMLRATQGGLDDAPHGVHGNGATQATLH
jgi:hypothetical protein